MSVLDRRAPITTKRYSFLSRCLAALTLMFIYVVSTSAILVGASTTEAQAKRVRARGRGYGRGYARGYGRGYRGRGYYGRGYGLYGGRGCYFSYRWGRVVCY